MSGPAPAPEPNPASGTVHVVDDDPAVRDSLRRLIESIGLEVDAHGSADELLLAVNDAKPGCLVVDVRMRSMSGLELQRRLRQEGVLMPVIIITGYGDVPTAVRAMKAGAVDFIEKPVHPQVLLDRVQQALALDTAQKNKRREFRGIARRLATLSPRERQVLDGVVEGKMTKQIAEHLGLKVKTVDAHRARMMRKMQAGSVAELVHRAVTYRMLRDQFGE